MDDEERELLVELAGQLLRERRGVELVDEICDSQQGAAVWDDPAAWGELAELQGRLAAASPLMDLVVLRDRFTDSGHRLLLPRPGSSDPVSHVTGKAEGPGEPVACSITVDGVLLGDDSRSQAVVAVDADDVAWSLPLDTLKLTPASGLDPGLGAVLVRGTSQASRLREPGSALWLRAFQVLGRELLGVGEAALAEAIGHARDREQFGRPIASFQVVAHRLAQARVDLTAARELLDGIDGAGIGPIVAKAAAGRAALGALAVAQQVCGAMGFTAEFGLHHLVRRGYLLDALLGGSETAPDRVGELVIASGVPRLTGLESSRTA